MEYLVGNLMHRRARLVLGRLAHPANGEIGREKRHTPLFRP